jgi:Skp family chaperone for outer membrane proteins
MYRGLVRSVVVLLAGGCATSPRWHLSAADSMELAADSFQTAIAEFARDLEEQDRQRRQAVIEAFVTRVQRDHSDERSLALHATALAAALDRIESDRRATSDRRAAAADNLDLMREVAVGLRQRALESMNLEQDTLQYFAGVLLRGRTPPAVAPGGHDEPQP